MAEPDRQTNNAVYVLTKKEVLASALPGALPRQAPRFPTILLAALEERHFSTFVFTAGGS